MASELDYSTTAADNTSINGVGIAGNNLPSNLDNAMRELAALRAKAQPRATLKSANYVAVKDDFGKTIVFSGTRTLTIPAISGLASGWNIIVEASASGVVTIAASSSNTINGASTLALPAGRRCRVFVSDSATDLKADVYPAGPVVPIAGGGTGATSATDAMKAFLVGTLISAPAGYIRIVGVRGSGIACSALINTSTGAISNINDL